MGGAQPLAVTMNDGVALVIEVDPERARRRLDIGYVDRLTESTRRGAGLGARGGRRGGPHLDRPGRQRRRDRARAGAAAASGSTSSPTRRPPTTRLAATSRPRSTLAGRADLRATDPAGLRTSARWRARWPTTSGRCSPSRRPARSSSTTATTCAPRRRRRASRTRSTTRASCRPSSGRSSARARGRSAGRRCPAIRRTSRRTDEAVLELFPDDAGSTAGSAWPSERVPFQGLPARICWLGYGERARAGLRVQRAGPHRRGQRAHRHRPRPPRRGLGRLTQPRDGGDARRLRRDRRLAAPQRAGQHRRRRDAG